jgi:hypothetical protein
MAGNFNSSGDLLASAGGDASVGCGIFKVEIN